MLQLRLVQADLRDGRVYYQARKDVMQELFDQEDDYYNVVFADHALDIDNGRLYATVSKENVEESSQIFTDMMGPMVVMLVAISALIFMIVMYLMMKVMIDRSAFSISLMKVFGYRRREIRKLYLDGNFYVIAVGAAICIPLAKKCMDLMYPSYGIQCKLRNESSLSMAVVCDCVHIRIGAVFCNEWVIDFKA